MFEGGSLGHFKGSKKRRESFSMASTDETEGTSSMERKTIKYAWRTKRSLKKMVTGVSRYNGNRKIGLF